MRAACGAEPLQQICGAIGSLLEEFDRDVPHAGTVRAQLWHAANLLRSIMASRAR